MLSFQAGPYRNETEVESKLIVQYLLPELGYPRDAWHQEVAFGKIRLDFLAFALQQPESVLNLRSILSLVIEAKAPKEDLDKHTAQLKKYLTKTYAPYGVLTNGKDFRIYRQRNQKIHLAFRCSVAQIEVKIEEIRALIGWSELRLSVIHPQPIYDPKFPRKAMKILAIYHNKGGVGKTTTVVNLAAAIARQGKKVLIVDLDSQANTTFATGLAKFIDELDDDLRDRNILHVLGSGKKFLIPEVVRRATYTKAEVFVVPAHIELMEQERRLVDIDASKTRLLEKLKLVEGEYDWVIVDTPPSLNLYARIALITADYLAIPSDLKPFSNEGLRNVANFIEEIDEFRKVLGKSDLNVLGVIPSKLSPNAKFVNSTLPKREAIVVERYGFDLFKSRIFERDDLAKSVEVLVTVGELEFPDPKSIFDFDANSPAAKEFEALANELLQKVG